MRVVLAFVTALLLALPACAADYVEVARTAAEGGTVAYVDSASIKKMSDHITVMVKWAPEGKAKEDMIAELRMPTADYYVTNSAYDLKEKKYKVLEFLVYDTEGKVIYKESSEFSPDNLDDIPAKSVNEVLRDYVLKNVDKAAK